MAGKRSWVWRNALPLSKVTTGCNFAMSLNGLFMQARRQFLVLVGGGMVLAAGSGAKAGIYPDKAVEAWLPPSGELEIRRWVLAHGLLAPNPHNRQPWIADLRREGEITLICDGERLLPETDPYGRQILIGCGAFLELAALAAAERGYAAEISLFPNGEPALNELPRRAVVARIKLEKSEALKPDPLFAFIRGRHTNKAAYDSSKKVPAEHVKALTQVAASFSASAASLNGILEDSTKMQKMRDINRLAYEIELTTPRTYLESAKLFRVGPREIKQHRDGISIMGLVPRIMSAVGMFNRFEIPVKGSSNFKQVMDRWLPFETGSGYLWMATPGNTRKAQVECGRAYVRTHLLATSLKIDMHPLSQAVQEFVEVQAQNQAMYALLELDPTKVTLQMVARIGYGAKPVEGSPRRDMERGMLLKA